MIHERITIDGQDIILSAGENAEIRVWVNGEEDLYLPLVHNGELTITFTVAGIAALEEKDAFRYKDIETMEFWDDL
jgi:hypothetical protein